jgi:hypothetical protein
MKSFTALNFFALSKFFIFSKKILLNFVDELNQIFNKNLDLFSLNNQLSNDPLNRHFLQKLQPTF